MCFIKSIPMGLKSPKTVEIHHPFLRFRLISEQKHGNDNTEDDHLMTWFWGVKNREDEMTDPWDMNG